VTATPPSARTTVKRQPDRGHYDRDRVHAVLDEGLVAHVGLATAEGPVVIPMLYARDGDRLLLHGSTASRLLRSGRSAELCVAVTLVDGLVLARSAFHHSMNYRSVVVFGQATAIADPDERRAALDVLIDHIVPGRTGEAREPNDKELRSTLVLALPLDESSVKIRTGPPIDEDDDLDLRHWAGVVPVTTVFGEPEPAPDLPAGIAVPGYVASYRRP
jgi:nitroimidazol reductase NimA-like FMN-containing flavoprotein (pyridoxamine 5'-phosphate oxidase superfamily)